MGPLVLTRFDLVPTFFALLALIVLSNRKIRPYLSGFLLGIGALVKLWPMLLFVIYPKNTIKKASTSFASTLVLVILFMSTWSVGFTNFLNNQTSRGLQVESIAATPFVLAKLFGANVEYPFRYGSLEVQALYANQIDKAKESYSFTFYFSLCNPIDLSRSICSITFRRRFCHAVAINESYLVCLGASVRHKVITKTN
jgi:hypothetical protein